MGPTADRVLDSSMGSPINLGIHISILALIVSRELTRIQQFAGCPPPVHGPGTPDSEASAGQDEAGGEQLSGEGAHVGCCLETKALLHGDLL